MHSETHRVRFALFVFALTLLALMVARVTHAGWSTDPVEVHATSALCPLVAASDDAHFGAIVVWQEATAAGGVLKARHLLADGTLDPAWSAPVELSTMDIARTALGSVADGSGGAYVWWLENTQLFLTRVSATGTIAGGWPARGRSLGLLTAIQARPGAVLRPSVAADGSGGLYMAWVGATLFPPGPAAVRAVHLGPANTGKGGWPNGVRVLGTTVEAEELAISAAIAPATDGGLWLAFATVTYVDPDYLPGDVRLSRLTSAGLPASGWDTHGVSLAAFRGDLLITSALWGPVPAMSLAAVASDGGSGAYVEFGEINEDPSGVLLTGYRLARVAADGSAAAGWAAGGMVVPGWGFATDRDAGADASLAALADGQGGVLVGTPGFASEFTYLYRFIRFSGAGSALPGGVDSNQLGLEFAPRGDGGMYIASFQPTGPTSNWSPNAYVRAAQTDPGIGFLEFHDTPVVRWYGDVGLTATGDGGAIFVWSQVNTRYGVYAVRLSPAGIVTGVPPISSLAGPSLRARFVRGRGVLARLSLAGATTGELALVDVQGRRLASLRQADATGAEALVPGTADLPSGLYFLRASTGKNVMGTRVAVIR